MEIGYIKQRKIIEEMQESYLDYAMSVIVSRALPDIRDGLKPVHRRILYAMWDIGLRASAKYRKSATVVGEVLGKYHPHGDAAVYDSMVRMAQDFSMRYPLVNGQGNFGSVDGDTAAAMRYTEAKLSKISEEMLTDIEKETVDFVDNYDRSQREPSVLPAKLPNALLNGTMGIAVGMATNIPPHNLREIANGIAHLIDNPDATVDDLMEFVKGPDFPTGGLIFSTKDIAQAYYTGRGGIVMRAKADIVEDSKGAFKIVVTELPYQVNKAALIEKIATLVKDKKIEGIKDIRDESDKDGMSVIIELKKDAYPKKVLNRLYTLTQLQDKFHVNLLALVENGLQPRLLNLKTALEHYIQHRETVVVRRTKFELGKAKDRAHILEGLKKALDHIDEIIKTIKKSAHREEAHKNLVKKFKLSDKQAEAILEMKLSQLAALERQKIENELKEKKQLIKELEAILKSPKKIKGLIKSELKELTEKYGDDRRTKVITRGVSEFKQEDLVPNEEVIITLTKSGYIKCLPEKTYKSQGRGGKGVIGMTTKEEDMVMHFLATTTHSDILFFTNRGRVFQLKAYEIPKTTRQAKGQAIVNFLQLAPEEKITALVANESQNPGKYIAMITKNGLAKKVELSDFANVRRSGLIAIKLKKDDELRWAKYTTGDNDILLVTSEGQAIRFAEKDIRAMGRNAAGVRAIRLKKQNDEIVGMDVVDKKPASDAMVLVVTKNGFGKKSKVAQYKKQHRGGSGIKTAKITPKNGKIVTARFIDSSDEEIIIISKKGQTIRIALKSVSEHGRATQGIRIMRLKPGDEVSAIAII